jgi:drug/metabolite transporter (DMT)-like permease
MSLISDSLTAYFSEHIRHKFKPSSLQTFNNSCYCAIQIIAPVAVLVNLYNFLAEGRNCISYCLKFPLVINDILMLSLLSGFGQALVFWGISELGALAMIIITTLRKFTSIIISVAIFQHDFNVTQWICIGFAFLGALFEILGISLQSPHKIKP